MSVSRPEEVMQAYGQLQRDSNIEVEVERDGRSEILRYEIR
jgi:type II secretory pathway component PulC